MNQINKTNENVMSKLFKYDMAVIGMIHTLPFPGSPRYRNESISEIIAYSVNEAKLLIDLGVDGLMFENHGDIPFLKPEKIGYETVSIMTALICEVMSTRSCPFGINILANATQHAIAIAKATGAHWVRCNQWVNAYVANEGIIEGKAGEILRYRNSIGAEDVLIMSDVHVKHGSHAIVSDRKIFELAKDSVFFDADILIATGLRTGDSANLDEITSIKEGHDLPIFVGSGMSEQNLSTLFPAIDGVIVGSSLKKDGVWWNPIDPRRVKIFMREVNRLRT